MLWRGHFIGFSQIILSFLAVQSSNFAYKVGLRSYLCILTMTGLTLLEGVRQGRYGGDTFFNFTLGSPYKCS